MNHVPIAGRAVLRGVLAHGRYDDPVLQAQLADGDLFEQTAHDGALQFEIETERWPRSDATWRALRPSIRSEKRSPSLTIWARRGSRRDPRRRRGCCIRNP